MKGILGKVVAFSASARLQGKLIEGIFMILLNNQGAYYPGGDKSALS